MAEVDLVSKLMDYGLAGVVIFIFYLLFTRELEKLRQTIEKFSNHFTEFNKNTLILIHKIERYIEECHNKH